MNVTEISSDGLKREFKVVVDKAEIERQVTAKLAEISRRVKIPGFRPGKIPQAILKQRYGTSVMGEVIEKTVSDTSGKAVADKGLRPAMRPKIDITSFGEDGDLEYSMALEVLPEIGPIEFKGVSLEKPVFAVTDAEIEEALTRIAENHKSSEPVKAKRAAKIGDILTIDFKGTVDGEARPGMNGGDFDLELGTKFFIDTFEDQLVGAKPGDHRSVTVTFPKDYGAAELAGREAVFEVDIKDLKKPIPAALDDALAKQLGMESIATLKEAVRGSLQGEYDTLTQMKLKRALLDALAEKHSFPVPESMVEIEFEAIWKRVQEELAEDKDPKDKKKSEKDLKAEYRDIAVRRVRLGLLLNEIGHAQNLQVTQEELTRSLINEARGYPGQERQVMEFYRNNPQAMENLRAPLYEDKVVSYVLGQVKLKEKKVSKEELTQSDDET